MPPARLRTPELEDYKRLTEIVTERLREAIAFGELLPGEPVRQEALASDLGVSRQPIREAVRVLEHDGLIVRKPRSGLEVAPLTADDIRGVYEFRTFADRLAARDAVGTLSPRQVRDIETILARATRLRASNDRTALMKLDRDFHGVLYATSKNSFVRLVVARSWAHIARAMLIVAYVPGYAERAWQEHRAMFAAIVARDTALAERLAVEHVEHAGASINQFIVDQGEQILRQVPGKQPLRHSRRGRSA